MRYKSFILLQLFFLLLSCKNNDESNEKEVFDSSNESISNQSEDSDLTSNQIETVKIGNLEWSSKNLNVSTFRNGDIIFEAKTNEEWEKAAKLHLPAWCYYNNQSENGKIYGKLYNWFAVMDERGLAPLGFHIPNKDEYDTLLMYLGLSHYSNQINEHITATKLKSTNNLWSTKLDRNNSTSTNGSGYNALPGGLRYEHGSFNSINEEGNWWTTTGYSSQQDRYVSTSLSIDDWVGLNTFREAGTGLSIRCIKGETTNKLMKIETLEADEEFDATKALEYGKVSDIDGNVYKTVRIGKQIWMTENLKVSKFNNGELISDESWCYYDNQSKNESIYGKLYSWDVVSNFGGIAPKGWHIPSYDEINILFKFLGADSAYKMKSNQSWFENGNGVNVSGFNGLPSGYRIASEFSDYGHDGYWWTKTTYDEYKAYTLQMYYWNKEAYLQKHPMHMFASIRCIKD